MTLTIFKSMIKKSYLPYLFPLMKLIPCSCPTDMVDSPLFIRSHSKAALTMAVHYDSMFLASHFIMDYSLLVGLDTASDELVVGIIGELSGHNLVRQDRSVHCSVLLMHW